MGRRGTKVSAEGTYMCKAMKVSDGARKKAAPNEYSMNTNYSKMSCHQLSNIPRPYVIT